MTNITLKRIPILMISEVMNQIQRTDVMNMVFWKGHIISPTLPTYSIGTGYKQRWI